MDATLIFPNHLFNNSPALNKSRKVYLFQDPIFFKDEKYPVNFHKKKLLLHISSMESYNLKLISEGYNSKIVYFHELAGEKYFNNFFIREEISKIYTYRLNDHELNKRLLNSTQEISIKIQWFESPLFLMNTDDIEKEFN